MCPVHRLATASAVLVSLSVLSACGNDDSAAGRDTTFTVTGKGKATDPRLDQAVAAYRVYIGRQVDDTLAKTKTFAASVSKGDMAGAKAEFAPSRFGWEAIEPVAESFGDIDPKVDTREADLEKGRSGPAGTRSRRRCGRPGRSRARARSRTSS